MSLNIGLVTHIINKLLFIQRYCFDAHTNRCHIKTLACRWKWGDLVEKQAWGDLNLWGDLKLMGGTCNPGWNHQVIVRVWVLIRELSVKQNVQPVKLAATHCKSCCKVIAVAKTKTILFSYWFIYLFWISKQVSNIISLWLYLRILVLSF